MGLEVDGPAMDTPAMGTLVERIRTDLSAFSDPVTRTANQLRSLFRKRARKPLVLDLPGKTLVFSSPAEFEFGLASRIEFPVRKAARLVERDSEDLKGMAIKLRAVEKRFAAVFARCLEQPYRIGELLGGLESGLLSQDHDWRDIVQALCEHGPEYDDFKNIALVKYMQYLASRQAVLRSIYLEKVQGGLELQPQVAEEHPVEEPMLASVTTRTRERKRSNRFPAARPSAFVSPTAVNWISSSPATATSCFPASTSVWWTRPVA
jgi:hypothetical protein